MVEIIYAFQQCQNRPIREWHWLCFSTKNIANYEISFFITLHQLFCTYLMSETMVLLCKHVVCLEGSQHKKTIKRERKIHFPQSTLWHASSCQRREASRLASIYLLVSTHLWSVTSNNFLFDYRTKFCKLLL